MSEKITEFKPSGLEVNVEGFGKINLKDCVFDFNGTIGVTGKVCESSRKSMWKLVNSGFFQCHVITSDTFGSVKKELSEFGDKIKVVICPKTNASEYKKNYVKDLGNNCAATFGNGANDIEMSKVAALSFSIIREEGCCSKLLLHTHLTCTKFEHAIDIVLNPNKIRAGLRT